MVKRKNKKAKNIILSTVLFVLTIAFIGGILGISQQTALGTPVGSPTAFIGKVILDGQVVTSGMLDCKSGGESRAQSGAVAIQSDGSFDMICIGGSFYEFYVNDVKYDTTWAYRTFGEVVDRNVIKGSCGSFCNAPIEQLSCNNFYMSGNFDVTFPSENGGCPIRCLSSSSWTSASFVSLIDGQCAYRKKTRAFGMPQDRIAECNPCFGKSPYVPPVPELECTNDAECGLGFECINNDCSQKICPTCSQDSEFGECTSDETQSKSVFVCNLATNFECQEQLEFRGCIENVNCQIDSECNDEYMCYEGGCVPDIECSSDSDCIENMKCQSNECIPNITQEVIKIEPGFFSYMNLIIISLFLFVAMLFTSILLFVNNRD